MNANDMAEWLAFCRKLGKLEAEYDRLCQERAALLRELEERLERSLRESYELRLLARRYDAEREGRKE